MLDPNVRPVRPDDAALIAANLKADDRQELEAIHGENVGSLIPLALQWAHKTLAWGPEGAPKALFGVAGDPAEGVGYIWALSTPDILTDWRRVHRATPAILDHLGEGFSLLANIKDARHRHHIRWLRSLGFTFIATHTVGPQGLPFHEFVRIQT